MIAIKTDGLQSRMSNESIALYRNSALRGSTEVECRRYKPGDTPCLIGDLEGGAVADTFIWGDSHTGAQLPGLETWLQLKGRRAHAFIKNGCAAILGVDMPYLGTSHGCAAHNAAVLAQLRELSEIKTVILSGRWAFLAEGHRSPGEHGANAVLKFSDGTGTDNFSVFEVGLRSTISALRDMGKQIILLQGTPEVGRNVSLLYMNDTFFERDYPITIARADYVARNMRVAEVFASIEAAGDITFIPVADRMCPDACLTRADGILLYRDDDHLSPAGARWLLSKVMP